jgi:hypothetical protein
MSKAQLTRNALRDEVELQRKLESVARRIDGIASGDEWWCDELAAVLDALEDWRRSKGGNG